MNRTRLGLLAGLMVGLSAISAGPALAYERAPNAATAAEVARHRDKDGDDHKKKSDKDADDKKKSGKDDHKNKWDKDDRKDGDHDDRGDRRRRDGDDDRCVGLIVICL